MTSHKPVCLITGGTAGIGLATAKIFASHGYDIATCGRNQDRLTQAKNSVEATGAHCLAAEVDLANSENVASFFQQVKDTLGRVDVLVNNAALSPFGPFEDITFDEFHNTMEVNVRAVFQLTQSAYRLMKDQGRGAIVNISSMAAVDPFTGFSLYGATKAWMDLLTTALADEGKEKGIRVYSIRPGAVETKMLRSLFPDFPADQCVPPETIAEKVWACVSDAANHQSGSHYAVTNQS